MKKALLLVAVLLFTVGGFAQVNYNNFNGYDPYWQPFGNPNTSTYGETFTAPNSPNDDLVDFAFYLTGPVAPGNIILGGYIATWTGSHAGTLLYSSSEVNYPNTGEAELVFNTGGLTLNPGGSYVMFLSVSNYYGQSSGEAQVSSGSHTIPGGGFDYYNNAGNFNELFTNNWDASGLTPDWAVNLDFTSGAPSTPEPGTLALLGTGLIGVVGFMRRKLF
jgi:PEP-CTERM motif-containing protein